MTAVVRIATRKSQLALWQARWVAAWLREEGAEIELVEITTEGDLQQSGPVVLIGQQGVFTKQVQAAVLEERADIAVHSLKDLPTETEPGLSLAAVPEREVVADALVSREGQTLAELPAGARIGTGSQRRRAQLLHLRPDLEVVAIRGNVDTRLRKIESSEVDAVLLAAAGLQRLGLGDRIAELLEPPRMLPAPGQGALGIECRVDNTPIAELLGRLGHEATQHATAAERSMLAELHGGCSAPIGAWARRENDLLVLDGLVASLDGGQVLKATASGPPDRAISIGEQVARDLLAQDAGAIISAARGA